MLKALFTLLSLSSGYFKKIIPGSFSTSWEVYSPGSLLGAHHLIKHNYHLSALTGPHLYSWVKRSNSWLSAATGIARIQTHGMTHSHPDLAAVH